MVASREGTKTVQDDTTVAQGVEPMFDLVTAARPARADVLHLAAGTVGAIKIPGVLPADVCRDVVERTQRWDFDVYAPRRIHPPVAEFGPAAYDHYLDGRLRDEYWAHSDSATTTWREAVGAQDPLQRVIACLARCWAGPVHRVTVGGRPLFAGMIREFTGGARIHFDEVVREFPGVFDSVPIAQFGFNCHLSMPEEGGDLTVYRRRWRPRDDRHRAGYGWDRPIVEGEPSLTIHAEAGDAVIFDSRNYHSVAANTEGRRVTLSFFIGVTVEGRLVIWS
ncbi:MAG TPA: hypothetical protein VGP70_07635 [Actinomadura sp.]|nr:hypothetical protein [Actinomadura sp.]